MRLVVAATVASTPAVAADRMPELVPLPGGLAMTRTEITFDQWQTCVADGACPGGQDDHGWGRGDRPVINVSRNDAEIYARWLAARIGRRCRLPTEREWEAAAAAGTSTRFWWGDQVSSGMANCRDCAPKPIYGTTPAGSFPPNPWNMVDLNGNVWEWTADCWKGAGADCRQGVIKGGSWYYYSANSQTRARAGNDIHLGSYNIGIRVACH